MKQAELDEDETANMVYRLALTLTPILLAEHSRCSCYSGEEAARAVLEAMWEPTDGMIDAARQFSKPMSEREIWQAMIAAALTSTKELESQ